MIWRGAIVGVIVAGWIALGVAWGLSAMLVFGFFLVVACALVFAAAVGGGIARRSGTKYYERQLHGRRRR